MTSSRAKNLPILFFLLFARFLLWSTIFSDLFFRFLSARKKLHMRKYDDCVKVKVSENNKDHSSFSLFVSLKTFFFHEFRHDLNLLLFSRSVHAMMRWRVQHNGRRWNRGSRLNWRLLPSPLALFVVFFLLLPKSCFVSLQRKVCASFFFAQEEKLDRVSYLLKRFIYFSARNFLVLVKFAKKASLSVLKEFCNDDI